MEMANDLTAEPGPGRSSVPLAVAVGIWPTPSECGVGPAQGGGCGTGGGGDEGAGGRAPEHHGLALFHQQRLASLFTPFRVEEPEQHPQQAQAGAPQQQQLQPLEGASLPLPDLFRLLLPSGFLSLQKLQCIHVGPGVELSPHLLLHEAPVNGWPEDQQLRAAVGGVQDGAHLLARELVLPGQGYVVSFPDDRPAEEDMVSCSPQGGKGTCLKEVETAAPSR